MTLKKIFSSTKRNLFWIGLLTVWVLFKHADHSQPDFIFWGIIIGYWVLDLIYKSVKIVFDLENKKHLIITFLDNLNYVFLCIIVVFCIITKMYLTLIFMVFIFASISTYRHFENKFAASKAPEDEEPESVLVTENSGKIENVEYVETEYVCIKCGSPLPPGTKKCVICGHINPLSF